MHDFSSATRPGHEEGTVVAVHGRTAEVLLRRSRLCDGCGSCCVMVDSETMLAEADNPVGAEKGDRVIVDLPAAKSIRAALILYGVPLLAFLVGYGLGALLGAALFGGGYAVPLGLVFAFAGLAVTYILLSRIYASHSRASSKYRLVITQKWGQSPHTQNN